MGKARGASKTKNGSEVEGGLIGVTPAGIVGWARNYGRPEAPVDVVLLANDQPIARAVADVFANPLFLEHLDTEVPGFRVGLGALAGAAVPLTLTLRDASGRPLGKPLRVTRAPNLGRGAATGYEGEIEGLFAGELRGWAWDRDRPENPVTVELLDGDAVLDRMPADVYRDELKANDRRGGQCGFSFPLPATLIDGRPHSLRVLIADAGVALPNGPVVFGPGEHAALFDELARLRTTLDSIEGLVAALRSPRSDLQRMIMSTLNERLAAFSEIQRELIESELDAFRAIALEPHRIEPRVGERPPRGQAARRRVS
jgi:hypothetical protein